MTAQKSFKRLVRARMARTGESYTAARAQLLAGSAGPAGSSAGGAVPKLVCSDERIRERTGRGWEDWFALLDGWGAPELPHTEIARRVAAELDLDPLAWNVQAVVTSFEWTRGMREVGQRVGSAGFVASASKTIAAGAEEVFMAVADPSRRAGWLEDVELSERTATKPTSARFDVGDGSTRLLVTVTAKGTSKSTIAVEQSRLSSQDEREQRKAFWRDALGTLKVQLEADAVADAEAGR